MYLSTESVYDYDDWSSYFMVQGFGLPFTKLHVKFEICEA